MPILEGGCEERRQEDKAKQGREREKEEGKKKYFVNSVNLINKLC